MAELGRRIIFEKTTGKIIVDFGEASGAVLPERETITELDFVDFPSGAYADEFSRVLAMHIDPLTKQPVFDELADRPLNDQDYIEQLEDALLIQEGVI